MAQRGGVRPAVSPLACARKQVVAANVVTDVKSRLVSSRCGAR